jgi:ABC-type nitrate/sulfonate/bicarbonate transport system permease component
MTRKHWVTAVLGILVFWEVLALIVQRPILPDPVKVLFALGKEIRGDLLLHFFASLMRVTVSMVLSVVLAVPAGLVIGQSQRLNRIFSPVIYILYPIPKVVFVPILMLFFGVGDLAKILLIFIILFFQILVLVKDQAASIAPQLISSLRSLGAGRRAIFRFVYFPATLPAIFTALRQSIGTSIAVLYVAELFATQRGLGYYIYYTGSTLMDYPAMYAGILVMSILGLGLYYSVDLLENWLCPWTRAQHS